MRNNPWFLGLISVAACTAPSESGSPDSLTDTAVGPVRVSGSPGSELTDAVAANLSTCSGPLDFETDADGDALSAGEDVSEAWAGRGIHGVGWDSIDRFYFLPLTVLDSSSPGGAWEDLGTPNEAYGGPGVGSAGASNDVARGLLLGVPADTDDVDFDGLIDRPRPNTQGTVMDLWFDGPMCVGSFDLVDADVVDGDVRVDITYVGGLTASAWFPPAGNNAVQTITIDTCNLVGLSIEAAGTVALDDLMACPGDAECTVDSDASDPAPSCGGPEVCNGADDDGDGAVDEFFPDTDGDGTADCLDVEVCDGRDNDGDGETDEGFDADGNGLADCLGDCAVPLDIDALAEGTVLDDAFLASGVAITAWTDSSRLIQTPTVAFDTASPGPAHEDFGTPNEMYGGPGIGLEGASNDRPLHLSLIVPEEPADNDGDGLVDAIAPREFGGWVEFAFATPMCVSSFDLLDVDREETLDVVTRYSDGTLDYDFMYGIGDNSVFHFEMFRCDVIALEIGTVLDAAIDNLIVCPDVRVEECDGVDNDGDGAVDEDYPDTDGDGAADCVDVEECDGLDNDGDGQIDEDFAVDSDGDGVYDCRDVEECDGLDNDGDGETDEGSPDTDGDGLPDCLDREECDGLDNNGDGAIDEGFADTDGDGTADCRDREECDGLDNNGDGAIDEGFADTDGDGTADCRDVEECDGRDNDGDGATDETFPDTDADGIADCVDTEECDGVDNNGDGRVDEGYPDTDADGTADCRDREECDGVDNNGDGRVDEGYADTDADGTADCVDAEECDGRDNDGDGAIDEGFADTDGDGTADCRDVEECDGRDNDGDGLVDEDFSGDADGDGLLDCRDAEECDNADNDGDGLVDEGFDVDGDGVADCIDECPWTLDFDVDPWGAPILPGQDVSEAYAAWGVHLMTWNTQDMSSTGLGIAFDSANPTGGDLDLGTPNERFGGPGVGRFGRTSNDRELHNVLISAENFVDADHDGLIDEPDDDANGAWFHYHFDAPMCLYSVDLLDIESEEAADIVLYFANGRERTIHVTGRGDNSLEHLEIVECGLVGVMFDLYGSGAIDNIELCPGDEAEVCDGADNDGDGDIDEGFADTDSDGVADCVDTEECDGYDNDGDGAIDEGFRDTDADGWADCVDTESCDGLDNDGDGAIDEGFRDTDADGVADCVDVEECDGRDNDGDGQTDEGFADTDRDGVADCVDVETCDGVDNDGDGATDEGFADTDRDGIADCMEREECDGVDNDGDGSIDEGYADSDADGTADCLDVEECDGADNDGDGDVDEGFIGGRIYEWEQVGGGANNGGVIEYTEAVYDTGANTLTFKTTIRHPSGQRANGFTVAINNGPNPKGIGDLALFYYDASRPTPVVTVYGYNMQNDFTSFYDGHPSGGTQAPDRILSSINDASFVIETFALSDATRATLGFTIDLTALKAHTPLYGGPWSWYGAGFSNKLGLWFHNHTNLSTTYSGGWLTAWNYAAQGWIDNTNVPTTSYIPGDDDGDGVPDCAEECRDASHNEDWTFEEAYASPQGSTGGHALWLPGFFSTGNTAQMRMRDGARAFTDADGDLHLSGTAYVYDLGGGAGVMGSEWEVEATYAYRGTGAAGQGPNGPKRELASGYQPTSVTDSWRYYDVESMTLRQVGGDDTATLRGVAAWPVQLGATANGKNLNFGLSSWFTFTRYDGGVMATNGTGDINVDLEPLDLPECEPEWCFDEGGNHSLAMPGVAVDLVVYEPGSFVEYEDGTAAMTGRVYDPLDPRNGFVVEVELWGRTDTPPPGSPYVVGSYDPADWYYYEGWSGTMTGTGRFEGGLVTLSQRGPAFQIGWGANHKDADYGASAWFWYETIAQPRHCDPLPARGEGDINIDLFECDDEDAWTHD
jgi:hypothetical protein